MTVSSTPSTCSRKWLSASESAGHRTRLRVGAAWSAGKCRMAGHVEISAWPAWSGAAEIELHAVPVEPVVLSARQLRDTSDFLARRLRTLGVVSNSASIDVGSDSAAAWALMTAPSRLGGWDQLRPEATLGVRVSATGQRSVWQQLPADSMGSLLDPDELPGQFRPTAAHPRRRRLSGWLAVGVGYRAATVDVHERRTDLFTRSPPKRNRRLHRSPVCAYRAG